MQGEIDMKSSETKTAHLHEKWSFKRNLTRKYLNIVINIVFPNQNLIWRVH